ncbi:MAG: response regulator transcription factor [Deltaproteobacteria bacterium]|nr:response regulator transcription factor [Deltaproteobacteria bacterium]
MRILIVDDSAALRELVGRALVADGHSALFAQDVASADEILQQSDVDLVILDLALPDGWGIDWCRRVRAEGMEAPVLVLSAHSTIAERVAGLDAGADDFLPKPFAVAELRSRVRALGRRRTGARSTVLVLDDVRVELAARQATRAGVQCPITAREWSVLECLAGAKGRVVSRDNLLAEVWGDASESAARSLDVLIARIRKKLAPAWIRTVRGDGYALGV